MTQDNGGSVDPDGALVRSAKNVATMENRIEVLERALSEIWKISATAAFKEDIRLHITNIAALALLPEKIRDDEL